MQTCTTFTQECHLHLPPSPRPALLSQQAIPNQHGFAIPGMLGIAGGPLAGAVFVTHAKTAKGNTPVCRTLTRPQDLLVVPGPPPLQFQNAGGSNWGPQSPVRSSVNSVNSVSCSSLCSNKWVKGVSFWRNCGATSVGEWNTKMWFINGVDNVNWPPYRDWKADVSSARNVSFSISVRWSIYIINSVDKPNFYAPIVWRVPGLRVGHTTLSQAYLLLRLLILFWTERFVVCAPLPWCRPSMLKNWLQNCLTTQIRWKWTLSSLACIMVTGWGSMRLLCLYKRLRGICLLPRFNHPSLTTISGMNWTRVGSQAHSKLLLCPISMLVVLAWYRKNISRENGG